MKRIILISLFSTLFSILMQSQNHWIVKVDGTSTMMNPIFPTIDFAAERRFKNNQSLSVEFGKQFFYANDSYKSTWGDSFFIKQYGYKGFIEFRKYKANKYWGVNLFYKQQQENIGLGFGLKNDTINTLSDFFVSKKSQWGTNFIIGKQTTWFKRLVIDCYAGVGIRFAIIKNYDRYFDSQRHQIIKEGETLFSNFNLLDKSLSTLSEDSGLVPSAMLGIRLGFLLN